MSVEFDSIRQEVAACRDAEALTALLHVFSRSIANALHFPSIMQTKNRQKF